jgi:hypothetical protein
MSRLVADSRLIKCGFVELISETPPVEGESLMKGKSRHHHNNDIDRVAAELLTASKRSTLLVWEHPYARPDDPVIATMSHAIFRNAVLITAPVTQSEEAYRVLSKVPSEPGLVIACASEDIEKIRRGDIVGLVEGGDAAAIRVRDGESWLVVLR